MSKTKRAGFNLPGIPPSKRQDYPVVEAALPPSKTKHTPGPWKAVERSDNTFDVIQGERDTTEVIAEIIQPVTFREREANARLIAAAPALLEALIRISKSPCCCDPSDDNTKECDACHARLAIAKAEGKE